MLQDAHRIAVDAAREAGRIVRGYYQDSYNITLKGEDNPLTDADLASNRVLFERLRGNFPDFGWLSEEPQHVRIDAYGPELLYIVNLRRENDTRLNGEPVTVSDRRELQGSRVVCSRTEMSKGWFEPYKDLLVPDPVGSVAFKFGLVGAGRADATFTPRPRHEWDVAGGAAIVMAAGGRFTNQHGQAHAFNQPKPLVDGIAATNGHIHDAILGLMGRE